VVPWWWNKFCGGEQRRGVALVGTRTGPGRLRVKGGGFLYLLECSVDTAGAGAAPDFFFFCLFEFVDGPRGALLHVL
jgi:hypothetical protein